MALTKEQIINQSKSAMRQWGEQWKANAAAASKYEMKPFSNLEDSGVGRAMLLIANGYSFEKQIETIKTHQRNVDILVCDKALGHCLEHGIIPKYVIVCDANVSFEKYCEKWKDQLQDTILLANVCANPKWADNGNWRDRYFFMVKDSIQTELIFGPLSGCKNVVAAGTNVSNSMVIVATQCDNEKRRNFLGYDKYLLIGFDYCWTPEGNYYAFDHDAGGKQNYMRHIYGRTTGGGLCFSSNNLVFSMQWLQKYIETYKLPVVNCSHDSVLSLSGQRAVKNLEEQMQYRGSTNRLKVKDLVLNSRNLREQLRTLELELTECRRAQVYDFLATA